MKWDHEFDVVVIGSGAAGMAAALTASLEGLSELVVEKTSRIGGTTAVSGGAMWIPLNSLSETAGHPDTPEKIRAYLHNTAGMAASEVLIGQFLRCGPRALDDLTQRTRLKVNARTYSPDYYPELEGAALGGRSVDPVEFDGRLLGARFALLRDPIRDFMVLGGMMVNLADVRHLLAVTRSFASWKHGMRLVLRYWSDRLCGYHRGTRLLLGNSLAAQLFLSLLDREIEYWLDAPARELIRTTDNSESAVNGVRIERAGRSLNVRAQRGVVIATGGFAQDATMREQYFPKPTGPYSMMAEGSQGDGISLARRAGARMGKTPASVAYWAPVSVLRREDGSLHRYPHLIWDRAKPGLLAVNSAGKRFVNESSSYHDFVEGMYRSHRSVPTIPAALICDSTFIRRWGLGLALPGGRPLEHLVRNGYLTRAGSIAELAKRLKVPPTELAATISRFNDYARIGTDPEFNKGGSAYNRFLGDASHSPNPCLGPVAQAPFYAVLVYPGDVGTAWGIDTDEFARALDEDGKPIRGLYIAGADMQSLTGGAYPAAGVSLGPALTFGWVSAMHMAHGAVGVEEIRNTMPPATTPAS